MSKILIIDDDDAILEALRLYLEQENHTIFTAMDGEKGLEVSAREKLDLVILDLVMPNLSGYDICRTIREKEANKHVPIMILSALNDSESRTLALKVGADAYLSKFFEMDEFLACVNSMLRIKQLYQELKDKAHEYES